MGDGESRFDHIYRSHYDDVRRFVARRVVEKEADDVTAEIFVVVWRRLAEIPDNDRLLPWLYGIARNTLTNEYRRVRRADALAEQVASRTERRRVRDHADDIADRMLVAAAFDRLAEQDREVLRLVGWECLNSAQVAVVLGCARTTAAMRVNRARRRLRNAMRSTSQQRFERENTVGAVQGAG